MRLFRKIDIKTGLFVEDILLNSPPLVMGTVTETQKVFNEETGEPESIEVEVERPVLDEEGNPIPDPQYIAEPVPPGFYWPRWDGTQWEEGLTEEEIAEIKNSQPAPGPTDLEVLQATVDSIFTEVLPSMFGL